MSGELGPSRRELTDLTITEALARQSIVDSSQSMGEQQSVEQLRNESARIQAEITEKQARALEVKVALAELQSEISVLGMDLIRTNQALQLADDKNPGAPQ